MSAPLDLDALERIVKGWHLGTEYSLDPEDAATVKATMRDGLGDFATFYFDAAARDFLVIWTAAPALIARLRELEAMMAAQQTADGDSEPTP
ncbi:MAG: hypothetical protein ACRCU1_18600 [Alsobacter sp.]